MMQGIETSHGIIIKIRKLTETSLIVRWWTLEQGLIETVARGARKTGSAFAGRIDLFYEVEFTWQVAKRGTLHTLKECSVKKYRDGIAKSYEATLLAGYFVSLLDRLTEIGQADEALYDLLTRALDHVAEQGASVKALTHFEKELAKLLGVGNTAAPMRELADLAAGLPVTRKELLERLGQ